MGGINPFIVILMLIAVWLRDHWIAAVLCLAILAGLAFFAS